MCAHMQQSSARACGFKEALLLVCRTKKQTGTACAHIGDGADLFTRSRQSSSSLPWPAGERAFTGTNNLGIAKANQLRLPGQSDGRSIFERAAQKEHSTWQIRNVMAFKQRLSRSIRHEFEWHEAQKTIGNDEHMTIAIVRKRSYAFRKHRADFLEILLPVLAEIVRQPRDEIFQSIHFIG